MCYNQGLVFQPEIDINYGDLSFTTWSNISIWDKNSEMNNEVDFTLTYSKSIFNFDIESSLNYYYYFNEDDPNTAELSLKLSYPLGDFSLFTGLSVDILENPGGIYDELGVEYEKEINDHWTIDGSVMTAMASSKFNSYYLDVNKSAFNFIGLNATLTYSPLKDLHIDAHYQINQTLDEELKNTLLGKNPNYFEVIFRKEF